MRDWSSHPYQCGGSQDICLWRATVGSVHSKIERVGSVQHTQLYKKIQDKKTNILLCLSFECVGNDTKGTPQHQMVEKIGKVTESRYSN